MQAEFAAFYRAITQAIWLKNLILGFVVVDSISGPLWNYYDKSSTIVFTKNNKSSSASKYLEIKHLTIKDLLTKGDIMIGHINTKSMISNPLTKGLRPIVLKKHVDNMEILESFDVLN